MRYQSSHKQHQIKLVDNMWESLLYTFRLFFVQYFSVKFPALTTTSPRKEHLWIIVLCSSPT